MTQNGARADLVYRERLSPSLWAIVSAAVVAPMAALMFAPLDKTLALSAGIVVAVAVVAFLLTGQGDYPRAIDILKDAVKAQPNDPEPYLQLAYIYARYLKKMAPAIRYASGDDPEGAAAIREIDLRKKYYVSPSELAERVKLTTSKAKAVRDFLRIDEDPANVMVFEFGSQKHPRYSDNALRALREAITPELVEQAWQERPRRRGRARGPVPARR